MVLISLKVIQENVPDEPVKSSLKERRRKALYYYALFATSVIFTAY